MLNQTKKTIPNFPNFIKLDVSDRDWFLEYSQSLPAYSDFSFNTLIVWFNQKGDLEISALINGFVLRYSDVLQLGSDQQIYTVFGEVEANKTVQTIFDYQNESGLSPRLDMVPEYISIQLSEDKFTIEEDRDDDEYILDVDLLANLPGKQMRSIREDRNAFNNKYGSGISVVEENLKDLSVTSKLFDSYQNWEITKPQTTDSSNHGEDKVIQNILDLSDVLEYKNLSIYIDDELASFCLYYRMAQADYVVPNIIKMNYEYQDIFDFTVHSLSVKVAEDGVKYLNFEQDLGIEGLRNYKTSLKPIGFLKKYKVSPK